ncbi:hypothetical protein INR49_007573, partial [Caranx melampygus]
VLLSSPQVLLSSLQVLLGSPRFSSGSPAPLDSLALNLLQFSQDSDPGYTDAAVVAMVVVTPVATVSADGEGGVMAAFPRQNLQVEGGDDLRGAWQEGERGEVKGEGGRQGERLDERSSSDHHSPTLFVFIFLHLHLLLLLRPVTLSSGTDPRTLDLVWTVDGETQRDVTQSTPLVCLNCFKKSHKIQRFDGAETEKNGTCDEGFHWICANFWRRSSSSLGVEDGDDAPGTEKIRTQRLD